jgi:glycerophosphoryl diester phosphodiesterase
VRRLLAALTTVAATAVPAAAQAQTTNPWLERRVLNMSHQGGENEHPSGTMYALRESMALGADMLELDVQPTKDGHLMVLHDASVERTTGKAASVYDLTLAEVQKLDAAHNFVAGEGTRRGLDASKHPFRGVRLGKVAPPVGYTAEDFRIPTLEETLRAFPDVPINIEIKGRSDQDRESFSRNADLLVDLLRRVPHDQLIVVSFDQAAVDRFHRALPDVALAPGITGVAQFMATGVAPEGTRALQVPPSFSGVTIMTPDFVRRAHAAGQAVHVWFSGQEESERVYGAMLDMGADGLMPAKPRAAERFLCERGTPRLPGNPNHCFGGAKAAAAQCTAVVERVGRASGDGRVAVTLRRSGPPGMACAGSVRLRRTPSRGNRGTFGAAAFRFPYGIVRTETTVLLGGRARSVLRRGRGRLAVAAVTRVDGASRERARRVALRR